jgi:hypothetical protein
VLGQWDLSQDNFLIKRYAGKCFLVAIDFANIWQCQRGHYGELPYVKLGKDGTCALEKDFPFEAGRNVRHPTQETLEQMVSPSSCELQRDVIEQLIRANRPNNWLVFFGGAFWKQYYRNPWNELQKNALYDSHLGLMPAYVQKPSADLLTSLENFQSKQLPALETRSWTSHWKIHVLERCKSILS